MPRILLVEDDPIISEMYHTAFKFDNFDVQTAADGEAGLALVKSWQPKLVLLDIMMPKMNGLEVLKIMKQDEALKNIPVIVLSNLSDRHDAETALALGAVKYIIKAEHTPKAVTDMVKEIMAAYTRDDIPAPKGEDIS
jgi:adenylate cyclase